MPRVIATWRTVVLVTVVTVAVLPLGASVQAVPAREGGFGGQRAAGAPPRAQGYFQTAPVGSWRSLPGGKRCASRVHRSTWEPRPDNVAANHRMPNRTRVHHAFAIRPLSGDGGFNRKWDSWLLPRVTGHYTGTTDEIFQWGACKWGIADNVIRAIAVRESTWYQYEVYPSGRCVTDWGCGDFIDTATPATRTYCTAISRFGHDYQADYGSGLCPETFSIAGVMSWENPSWGLMKDNQNGTFPFNRNSTAFAVDYLSADLRGCLEGWEPWLDGTGPVAYHAGDLWGCVGSWYAGEWRTTRAMGYVHRVRRELRNHTWLESDWPHIGPSCSAKYGCPQGG